MDNNIDRCIAVMGLSSKEGAMAATLHEAGWDVTGFDPFEAAKDDDSSGTGSATTAIEDLAGTPNVLSLRSEIVESTVPQLLAALGTVAVPPVTGVLDEYPQTKAIGCGPAQQALSSRPCPARAGRYSWN